MIAFFRLILWLLGLALIPVAMAFAVANREGVSVSFHPLPFELASVPLYLLVLAAIAIGFAWGGLLAWVSGARARKEARRSRWEASQARKEAAALRDHVNNLEAAKAAQSSSSTPAVPEKVDAA